MKYLDAVVNEVMRMDTQAVLLNRICTKDYHVEELGMTKGSVIYVPVYAFHHKTEYFPDPERFDPAHTKLPE